jgi:hypothetical protein
MFDEGLSRLTVAVGAARDDVGRELRLRRQNKLSGRQSLLDTRRIYRFEERNDFDKLSLRSRGSNQDCVEDETFAFNAPHSCSRLRLVRHAINKRDVRTTLAVNLLAHYDARREYISIGSTFTPTVDLLKRDTAAHVADAGNTVDDKQRKQGF